MKRIALAFSVVIIWFGLAGSYYVCVIKGLCAHIPEEPVIVEKIKNNKEIKTNEEVVSKTINIEGADFERVNVNADTLYPYPLEIYYNGELISNYDTNFLINKNDSIVTISENLETFGALIKEKMSLSNNSTINIYSYYDVKEDSIIGIGRANYIKEKLKGLKISETRILVESQEAFIDFNAENKFEGGIELNFDIFKEEAYQEDDYVEENYKDYSNDKVSEEDIYYTSSQTNKSINKEVVKAPIKEEQNIKIKKKSLTVQKRTKIKQPLVKTEVNEKAKKAVPDKSTIPLKEEIVESNIVEKETVEKKVVEEKKEIIEKVVVEKKKIKVPEIKTLKSTIVSESSFKGSKLKSTDKVREFISEFKQGQKVYITGYSNESKSSFDNYQEGLSMANSVKAFMKKKGIPSTEIILNAKKQEKVGEVKKGVILQIR